MMAGQKGKTMKITKKAINEAPKYIILLDPKSCGANNKEGFYKALGAELYYKALNAKSILEAMAEAESYYNETTFLINIAEKTGEVDADTEGLVYNEILTTRSESNWHKCDRSHGEQPYKIAYNTTHKFFQLLGYVNAE